MTDAYKIGGMGTDVLTGRTSRILSRIVDIPVANSGHCVRIDGVTDYQVPAATTFHITGFILPGINNVNGAVPDARVRSATNAALTAGVTDHFPVPRCTAAVPLNQFMLPTGDIPIAAARYLGVFTISASNEINIVLFGYEQV